MAFVVGDLVQVYETTMWLEAKVIGFASTLGRTVYEVRYLHTQTGPVFINGSSTGWYKEVEVRASLQTSYAYIAGSVPVPAATFKVGDTVEVFEDQFWVDGVITKADVTSFGTFYLVRSSWYGTTSTNMRHKSKQITINFTIAPPKKVISLYPHKCPHCGYPAYTGCVPAALDCSRGCHNKR